MSQAHYVERHRWVTFLGVTFLSTYLDDPEGLVLYLAIAHSCSDNSLPTKFQPSLERMKYMGKFKFDPAEPLYDSLMSSGASSKVAREMSEDYVAKSNASRQYVASILARTWEAGAQKGRDKEEAFLRALGFVVAFYLQRFDDERAGILRDFALNMRKWHGWR